MVREQCAYRIIENTWITMWDGCRLAARIWLPDGARETPVPAILEYLPYRKRDATSRRDEITHGAFARAGYACVRVDIRGNGDSDGLMEDKYTPSELDDGVAIIRWVAEQPWCSGKVGIIGISFCDVRPDGSSALVTWAPLNLTHDDRHETTEALKPERWVTKRLILDDVAYEVPAGNRLRLVLSTTYWPMLWPSPEPVILTARLGTSRLELPLAAGGSMAIARPEPAPKLAEPPRETTEPARGSTRGERCEDGTIVTEIRDDFGHVFNPATGLCTESSVCRRFEIRPSDPLSARLQARWTQCIERTGWRVSTESATSMHADERAFHLSARLEAYENEALVFERVWKEVIPRDHQ